MKNKFLPIIEKKFKKPTENLYGETIYYFDEEKEKNNDDENIDIESKSITNVPNKSGSRDNKNIDIDNIHNSINDNDNNNNIDNKNSTNNNDNDDNINKKYKNNDNKSKYNSNNQNKNNNEVEYDLTPVVKINIPIPKGGMINWRDLVSSSAVKLVKKEVVEEVEMLKELHIESVTRTEGDSGSGIKSSDCVTAETSPSTSQSVVNRSTTLLKSATVPSPIRSSQPLEPTEGQDIALVATPISSSDSTSTYDKKDCRSVPEIKVVYLLLFSIM